MAAFSYIADSSVPRSRTWRLGVAEACWALGSPVGLFLGAYLFEMGGYLCVFSAAVCFHAISVIYTGFFLPEVPQPKVSVYSIGKYGYGSYGTITDAIPSRIRCFSENAKTDFESGSDEAESLVNPSYYQNGDQNTLVAPPPPYQQLPPPHYYHQQQPQCNNNISMSVDPSGVKDFLVGSLRAIVKKRPNHTRKCLLSLGLIMLLYGIMYHGMT